MACNSPVFGVALSLTVRGIIPQFYQKVKFLAVFLTTKVRRARRFGVEIRIRGAGVRIQENLIDDLLFSIYYLVLVFRREMVWERML